MAFKVIKPPRGVQLNKSHPLARGMVGCWLFNEGAGNKVFDLSGYIRHGSFAAGKAENDWIPGSDGVALDFSGNQTDYIDPGWKPAAAEYTLSFRVKWRDFEGPPLQAMGAHDEANHRLYIGVTGTGGARDCYFGAGDTWRGDVGPHGMSTDVWYWVTLILDGSTARYYVDETEKDSFSYSWSGTSTKNFLLAQVGGYGIESDNRAINGVIGEIYVYDRVLSAAERRLLHREPYAMFGYPLDARLFYIPVGEYSLPAGAGSYSLAGTAVSLPISRVVGASGGSYVVDGAAVGLLKDLLMGTGAGSYALSGNAVSLPVDRVIGAGAGSYSLTGVAVALLKDMLMSAGAGGYVITGTSVPFILGMSASPGAYTLTGAAVTLLKDLLISAAAGDYALTGIQVSLPIDRVMGAGSGAYVLTGAVADLLKDVLISAVAGSYTLTGSAVGLKRDLVITADGGVYILSGAAALLLRGWTLSAGAGSYVVTGADAALLRTLIMAATGGSYTLTGADIAFLRGKIMAAEGGSYAITGLDIDLLRALIITMGGGTYVLTGQAVDLTYAIRVARYALHAMKRSFALTPEERSFALHAEKRSFDLTPEDEDE